MLGKIVGFLKLLVINLKKGKFFLFLTGFTIIAFAIVFIVIWGVREGLVKTLETSLIRQLPPEMIKVTPKVQGVSFINLLSGFNPEKFKSMKSVITYRQYLKIANLKGVKKVIRFLDIPLPMYGYMNLSFLGLQQRGSSDIIIQAVDGDILEKGDVARGYSFTFRPDKPIPVVLPSKTLELYNLLAPSQGLPPVSEKMFIGLKFKIVVGESISKTMQMLKPSESKKMELDGVIVGFSKRLDPIDIAIPYQAGMWILREFYGKNYYPNFLKLYVMVSEHEYLPYVAGEISKMGLVVETSLKEAEFVKNIRKFTNLSILVFILIIGTFALLSAFLSFFAFIISRMDFIALLRVMGSSKLYVFTLLSISAIITSFVFSVVGSFLGFELVKYGAEELAKLGPGLINPSDFIPPYTISLYPIAISLLVGALAGIIGGIRVFAKMKIE